MTGDLSGELVVLTGDLIDVDVNLLDDLSELTGDLVVLTDDLIDDVGLVGDLIDEVVWLTGVLLVIDDLLLSSCFAGFVLCRGFAVADTVFALVLLPALALIDDVKVGLLEKSALLSLCPYVAPVLV